MPLSVFPSLLLSVFVSVNVSHCLCLSHCPQVSCLFPYPSISVFLFLFHVSGSFFFSLDVFVLRLPLSVSADGNRGRERARTPSGGPSPGGFPHHQLAGVPSSMQLLSGVSQALAHLWDLARNGVSQRVQGSHERKTQPLLHLQRILNLSDSQSHPINTHTILYLCVSG